MWNFSFILGDKKSKEKYSEDETEIVTHLVPIPYERHSMGSRTIMFTFFYHSYKIPCCPSNCWSA